MHRFLCVSELRLPVCLCLLFHVVCQNSFLIHKPPALAGPDPRNRLYVL
uniref:Uncharacterized protein n=1 Tax=Anguilla anguilla TaxID=7936 RepID=A0A0E9SZ13_ANGAN